MTVHQTLDGARGVQVLHEHIARDLLSRASEEHIVRVWLGERPQLESFSLYRSDDGAVAFYEADTWAEAWEGPVTDLAPAFEASVQQAVAEREPETVQYSLAVDLRPDLAWLDELDADE